MELLTKRTQHGLLLSSLLWTHVGFSWLVLFFLISGPIYATSIAEDRRWDYENSLTEKETEFVDLRTEDEKNQEIIKKFKEALRIRGKWLNSPLPGDADPDAILAAKDIENILTEFKEKNPTLAEIPIRVFIYESKTPNAWVARFNGKSKPIDGLSSEAVCRALGFDPSTGFIEMGITNSLLKILPKTRDALAFVIGHESGHIVEKHLQDGSTVTYEDMAKGWLDRHINEFAADGKGIDFMVGLFNLEDAIAALKSLFEMQAGQTRRKLAPHEVEELIIKAIDNAASSHPHEGVRLAVAEAVVRYKKRKLEVEISSTALPDFYVRLSEKEEPRRMVKLPPSVVKSLDLAFENNPQEMTPDFDLHTYSLSITTRSEVIDQLIQKLESLSTSNYLKAHTFYRTLARAVSSKSEDEKISFTLSDSTAIQLENWLKKITDQQREDIVKQLTRIPNSDKLLLRLSQIPKSIQTPGKWSSTETLTLSYFQKTIDSFVLVKKDGRHEKEMFSDDFVKSATPRLRSAITQLGFQSIKSVTLENAAERALNSISQRRFQNNVDATQLTATNVLFSMIDFVNWTSTHPEAQSLKLSAALALNSIQNTIIQGNFVNFNFPPVSSIQIVMKVNPAYESAWKYGHDVPGYIPDYSLPPFEQLTHLNLINTKKFNQHKNEVRRFFGDVVFFGLNPTSSNFNEIKDGISHSYNLRYDSLIADELIQRLSDVDPAKMPSVLEVWRSIRRRIEHEDLKISPDQKRVLGNIVASISNNVLFTSEKAHWSLGILENLGRLGSFWDSLTLDETRRYLKSLNEKYTPNRVVESMLLGLSRKKPSNREDAIKWLEILEEALTMRNSRYSVSATTQTILQAASVDVLKLIPHKTKIAKIKIEKLRSVLNESELAAILRLESRRRLVQAGNDINKLPDVLDKFEKELKLERSDTVTSLYRNALAQSLKIQPQNRSLIDPTEGQTISELSGGSFSKLARGFSGILEIVRELPVIEQISFIQFISGKTTTVPAFVYRIDDNPNIKKGLNYTKRNFEEWTKEFQQKMTESDELSRSLIIHSFLTGPTGILLEPTGQAKLEAELFKDVPAESRASISLVVAALKAAEGREYGLLLSYAIAQKKSAQPGDSGGLAGANLLKAFLESYGVPGTKFGQFMAFSSRFKAFRSAFESFQDSALPLSYIGMLKLLEKSMGIPWDPNRFEVLEIKGSGSVNIAITVNDRKLKSKKILNVLREDVEIEARNDFKRFQKFVAELNKISANSDLAFIGGVARLVEDSVVSEFDKPRAKRMHDYSEAQYAHRVGEWTVRSVHVDEVLGRSLVMDVAPGISARHILNSNPNTYKAAMKAFLSVAKLRIQGLGPDGKPTEKPIISDPDIHNGQFFIDEKTKTITLLDKGQSSTPTTADRELAKTIFRIAASMVKGDQVYLNLRYFESTLGLRLNETHINRIIELQKLETPIDRYLNIVGYLREIGKVPTATVDWGFEFYRLTELASQVDRHQELEIKSVLLKGPVGKVVRTALDVYGTKVKKNGTPKQLRSETSCLSFYGL